MRMRLHPKLSNVSSRNKAVRMRGIGCRTNTVATGAPERHTTVPT